ncbi:beta-lactamase [Sporocytophaga myxococcoides]|uniref:Beta-lactamase n=1 Tax=Sporocytophaga myxococcoides TaxID=153721 RepID=A0A098LKM2_9BACT|nr:MBL fold metallo-hydrolase [Sporocytophaga myxococcoides]GAL86713.1 beta-lactamase [Sporocytophaga myxococcoides]
MVWDLLRRKNRYELAEDVIGFKSLNVNFYLIGEPGAGNPWTIIDAGITSSGKKIIKEAANLFGKDNPPEALLLTHGHFDHVGGIPDLLKEWQDLKIYAHPLEIPYLTGDLNFPPPETVSGSSAIAYLLQLYSGKTLNFSMHVQPLPDGWVPSLEGWRYIHTPGISPGHVSFFRPKDKVLIAGDLISSRTKSSSISSIFVSEDQEIQGPPVHYNINHSIVCSSLKKIRSLNPKIAGVGQGRPISEEQLVSGLDILINVFEKEKLKEEELLTTNGVPDTATKNGHNFRKIGTIASVFSLLAVSAGLGYYFVKKR